jgi:hypothetical protein
MLRKIIGSLAVLVATIAIIGTGSATDLAPCQDSPSAAYLHALGVVDQFLVAWTNREQENGVALVSEGQRKTLGDDKLRDYVSGLSNPAHSSFIVGCGKRTGHGGQSFEFPVTLYFYYNGYPTGSGSQGSIKVGQTKDCAKAKYTQGWCVEALPQSPDLPVDR